MIPDTCIKDTPQVPLIQEKSQDEKTCEKTDYDTGYDKYSSANFISKILFLWAYQVLQLAKKTPLKIDYLGTLEGENNSKTFLSTLKYFWEDKKYKEIKSNALTWTILRANLARLLLMFFLSLVIVLLDFATVLLLKMYISYFQNPAESAYSLYFIGVSFICVKFFSIFLAHQFDMIQSVIGFKSRLELGCFIYNKVLNASPSSFEERTSQGEIVNYFQVDDETLSNMIQFLPSLLIIPLQVSAYIYLLFKFFGLSFLAGLAIILAFLGFNYKILANYRYLQEEMLKQKDNRMKLTAEAFDSIKFLKLYNWENEFKRRIYDERLQEIDITRKLLNWRVLNITFYWCAPVAVSVATIGCYQYMQSTLDIGNMLIGLALFTMLQIPIRELPTGVNCIIETFVSMKRIEKFLRQREIVTEISSRKASDESDIEKNVAIKINNVSFTWGYQSRDLEKTDIPDTKDIKQTPEDIAASFSENNSQESETNISQTIENNSNINIVLKNINLEIKKGELVAIIGEVCSGKSSLLLAILNNLIIVDQEQQRKIFINGSVGYVSQTPWIQNDTLKNNILFFKDYNPEKYIKTLEVCQLNYDLEHFNARDNIEIGEKGVNLSGGQKTRVALARAVYADTDILLLDDPISALDADVEKKIMKQCIIKYLKHKTRVIVTHSLQYLKYMDKIIYISNGEIKWTGSYHELLLQEFFKEMSAKLYRKASNRNEEKELTAKCTKNISSDEAVQRITVDEDQEIGVVKYSVYMQYFKYMGGNFFIVWIIVIMMLWQINKCAANIWLAFWSERTNQDEKKKWIFFSIYSTFGFASAVFIFFRISLLTNATLRLSHLLHQDMIEKLIRAPINLFHETIPRGQILNRLSRDLERVQITFLYYGSFLVCLFSVIGAIVICGIYHIYSLIFLPFLLIFGFKLTSFFLQGSRNLYRLQGISVSPLLNTLKETIPGAITIRAFNQQQSYLNKFFDKVNDNFKVDLFINGSYNWFGQQFDYISILFLIYLVLITFFYEEELTPQSIGMMLTYSLTLQKELTDAFGYSAWLETNMVSMERCLRYTQLDEEKPSVQLIDHELKNKKWPANGKIEFKDYSVRYRPNTKIVLDQLNLIIKPREKIGVIGRTGSGKSTLCLALFRILEPASGSIFIDDIDIREVGLDILRQSMTIIPQDPCLMKGTLKYNIDPFDLYSTDEIVQILTMIRFNYVTSENNEGLDKIIEENGQNLSVGEKQLICIARALLKKSKIIVMDEATAYIDIKTEEIIQSALHNFLSQCTLITIAHRIKTIINYDKILVLKDGKIAEFDTPSNLISQQDSLFYALYSNSVL